jgi:hypothetical protein
MHRHRRQSADNARSLLPFTGKQGALEGIDSYCRSTSRGEDLKTPAVLVLDATVMTACRSSVAAWHQVFLPTSGSSGARSPPSSHMPQRTRKPDTEVTRREEELVLRDHHGIAWAKSGSFSAQVALQPEGERGLPRPVAASPRGPDLVVNVIRRSTAKSQGSGS